MPVIAVLCVLAGMLVPRPFLAPGNETALKTRRILLLANPIHTDIAFPADPDVIARFSFLKGGGLPVDAPNLYWIVAGWGAREWYIKTPVWADARPGPLLKALTLDRSVMHVGLAGYIDPASPGVTALDVEPGKFNAMLGRTLDTFARAANGSPRIIAGAGYGRYDRFYEAKGRFNAFVGCNTWTDGVLRAGGFRTGWWNPLPQSLEFSLRLFNRLPDAGISKEQ